MFSKKKHKLLTDIFQWQFINFKRGFYEKKIKRDLFEDFVQPSFSMVFATTNVKKLNWGSLVNKKTLFQHLFYLLFVHFRHQKNNKKLSGPPKLQKTHFFPQNQNVGHVYYKESWYNKIWECGQIECQKKCIMLTQISLKNG